jgi:hypothetical protein
LWYIIQAQWGKGTTLYSVSPQHPLQGAEITQTNQDHVFQAIVYNVLPTNEDEEGRVCIHSGIPYSDVKEPVIKDKLQAVCALERENSVLICFNVDV